MMEPRTRKAATETFVGRSPFPLIALRNCRLVDATDAATVKRSLFMPDGFHGIIELEGASRDTYLLLRRAGWDHHAGVPVEDD